MATRRLPAQVIVTIPGVTEVGDGDRDMVLSPFSSLAHRHGLVVGGGVLIVMGVLFLIVGWYGIASRTVLAFQLPYLVSGGMAGMVMVIAGVALVALAQFARTITAAEDRIAAALAQLATPPHRDDVEEEVVRLGATGVFHRRGCRLGRQGDEVHRRDALANGVRPCLVCHRPDGRAAAPGTGRDGTAGRAPTVARS